MVGQQMSKFVDALPPWFLEQVGLWKAEQFGRIPTALALPEGDRLQFSNCGVPFRALDGRGFYDENSFRLCSGQKSPKLAAAPLGLCLLPAFVVLGVVPMVVGVFSAMRLFQ